MVIVNLHVVLFHPVIVWIEHCKISRARMLALCTDNCHEPFGILIGGMNRGVPKHLGRLWYILNHFEIVCMLYCKIIVVIIAIVPDSCFRSVSSSHQSLRSCCEMCGSGRNTQPKRFCLHICAPSGSGTFGPCWTHDVWICLDMQQVWWMFVQQASNRHNFRRLDSESLSWGTKGNICKRTSGQLQIEAFVDSWSAGRFCRSRRAIFDRWHQLRCWMMEWQLERLSKIV